MAWGLHSRGQGDRMTTLDGFYPDMGEYPRHEEVCMQAYSDPSRESDPYALPDVETFQSLYCDECSECGWSGPVDDSDGTGSHHGGNVNCPGCGSRLFDTELGDKLDGTGTPYRWFYWSCFPGCLPDSDPVGPFDTEADALADAQGQD